MVWFIVDDKFHASEEVLSIPREHRAAAIGLWTLAGAWSSDHLKDGFVPLYLLDQLAGSVDLAELLVSPAKLWSRKGQSGYQFRNWSKWQRTRADVDATRKAARDRKAAYHPARLLPSGGGLLRSRGGLVQTRDGASERAAASSKTVGGFRETPVDMGPSRAGVRGDRPPFSEIDARRCEAPDDISGSARDFAMATRSFR